VELRSAVGSPFITHVSCWPLQTTKTAGGNLDASAVVAARGGVVKALSTILLQQIWRAVRQAAQNTGYPAGTANSCGACTVNKMRQVRDGSSLCGVDGLWPGMRRTPWSYQWRIRQQSALVACRPHSPALLVNL
jgi:hypothetical protein